MQDYGIWTVITPLVTITLAVLTRQVILSLLAGAVVGYTVMAGFNPVAGVQHTLDKVIEVFASAGNTRTILFCFMVGGIIRLVQVTGGTQGMVHWLTEKAHVINNRYAVQLLAMLTTMLIFIESSISLMSAGTVTRDLAGRYNISREKMAYIIQSSCVASCSSIIMNGWGAAMMAIIGVQISQGYLEGEPFNILLHAMPYNLMAWFSIASVLFYIFSQKSWGPMKVADQRAAVGKALRDGAFPIAGDDEVQTLQTKQHGHPLHFIIPLLTTVVMVPVGLYITGDGNIAHGSGSTAVFWAVMAGTAVSFVYFIARRVLTVDQFFTHLLAGYSSMMPLGAIMTLAFLMGNLSAEMHTGQYITQSIEGVIPAGFSASFVFLIAALMSLATGTSWGTFAIMIPIGVQIGVATGIDPHMMIGAAISGAIFGDMTSPISDTGIVSSMATGNDHIDHIRTQFPYVLLTGAAAAISFALLGWLPLM
ncbi:Na+/H+ antiporter NhaC family protein [Photobacterium sp. TY1-4]|uniref:Na+/H+ antiporter NhaC family protein n=1 Tax=Photobacterium sp. TY1-4 TaxID=2899122 RepID=UPI0021C0EA5C|nr:Na+/H+ antiporter NhaC family protein [Photobacterium sp. TY1-4]UXH99919.1 sodium:proton antiporter [Photobacterium sp. TY1-4]